MMQCRMCSQRLTRPGKLCRECECELERARQVNVGDAAPEGALLEALSITSDRWPSMLRSPGAIVATAFALGLVGAAALHVADASHVAVAPHSVMLDVASSRGLRQVSLGVSPDGAVERPKARTNSAVQAPIPVPEVPKAEAPKVVLHTPTPREADAPADPARALGDALSRCGDESFFARPACEERARARYCADAATLPQCAVAVRDHGQ